MNARWRAALARQGLAITFVGDTKVVKTQQELAKENEASQYDESEASESEASICSDHSAHSDSRSESLDRSAETGRKLSLCMYYRVALI